MFLKFCHIVTDIINLVHTLGTAQDLGKDLSYTVCDHLTVGKGKIHG